MNIEFKFGLGQKVIQSDTGTAGVVRSASVSRGGVRGYWIEYPTESSGVRELYVAEDELQAAGA